jgi:hypothetical protein
MSDGVSKEASEIFYAEVAKHLYRAQELLQTAFILMSMAEGFKEPTPKAMMTLMHENKTLCDKIHIMGIGSLPPQGPLN